MARYFVQAAHTPEECLKGLDDIVAQGADTIGRYDFGCAVGDHSNHVCMTTLEGANEGAVRGLLPRGIQSKAQITEVGKFTADQVRSFHA